jgi:hypothetical protein
MHGPHHQSEKVKIAKFCCMIFAETKTFCNALVWVAVEQGLPVAL